VFACAQPAGALVAKARSLDQARAVVTFLDAASEKTLRSTVALTAARSEPSWVYNSCREDAALNRRAHRRVVRP
jgi:hypothetical protein